MDWMDLDRHTPADPGLRPNPTRECALCGRLHAENSAYCGRYCTPRIHAVVRVIEDGPATYEDLVAAGPAMLRTDGKVGYKLDNRVLTPALSVLTQVGRVHKVHVGTMGPVVFWVRPEHEAVALEKARKAAKDRGEAIGADCAAKPRRGRKA